ncbi:hypothetical protein [Streptomyces viridosporus]|uniref:hypothetical protein n=1 Tax=Streptomyces viridosporus TaxID=67581 RepID=UPI00331FBC9E
MDHEVIASYASLLAAVAALVTVGFALRQLKLLREQNRSGQRASTAAVEAADAARAAVTETARSRADTYAPRITVLSEAPRWPPLISNHASNGDRLFSSSVVHGAEPLGREELIFPESAGRLMWFVVHSVLMNEGASTARVRIMGDGQFIEGESPLLPGQVLTVPPLSSAILALSSSSGFWHRSWGAVAERYLHVRLRGTGSYETAYALASDSRK